MGGNVVSCDNDFNASFAGPRRDPSAARNLVLETGAIIHVYQVDIGLRSLAKFGQLDTSGSPSRGFRTIARGKDRLLRGAGGEIVPSKVSFPEKA
jgi:hypothetical protein